MRLRPLLFAGFLLPAALAEADERVGGIRILAAWARATPGPTAVVYLDLKNEGLAADRLVDASTPLAQRIEFHEHRSAAGVMSMRTVPAVPLEPGATVRLGPGGLHLMLFGIDHPLRQGERFPLTLTFERAGSIAVDTVTAGAGAVDPPVDLD